MSKTVKGFIKNLSDDTKLNNLTILLITHSNYLHQLIQFADIG